MIALAMDSSPLVRLDVVLCIDSPVSENLCFSTPLFSYAGGVWSGMSTGGGSVRGPARCFAGGRGGHTDECVTDERAACVISVCPPPLLNPQGTSDTFMKKLLSDRKRVTAVARSIRQKLTDLRAAKMESSPSALTDDLTALVAILEGFSRNLEQVQSDFHTSDKRLSGVVSLDDLLQAAHYLVRCPSRVCVCE